METSAFQKINIDKAFMKMIEEIHKRYEKIYGDMDEEEIGSGQNVVVEIEKKTTPKKKSCC